MSRIGRLPIPVPGGVDVTIDGQTVNVSGPKGALSHTVAAPITVERGDDGALQVQRPDDERQSRALHGLSRTLIANMITGVTQGYSKTLEIVGVGYRVQARGRDLEFALGFSHPVPGRGHRQAAGGRGRGQHPQAPQARPVQGQGRAVPGRGRQAQGREDG